MSTYRGLGSAGTATNDATLNAVTEQAQDAASSATDAATSATAASTSASAAASSASAASSSATTASGHATAAGISETNAATSATAASLSETNAAASETAAATSETNAAASETAAAASETAAAASETAAAASETAAASSETNAAASETAAAASASAAATSATNAATSETNAASSETAAEAARDAALAALDSFDDRYLGQKSSDPALDNDGNALVAGSLYFDTTSNVMKVYDGSQWLAAYASLSGTLVAVNNLSDLVSVVNARTNLGLGTAATTASTDYATAAQGTTADSALQPADIGSTVQGYDADTAKYDDTTANFTGTLQNGGSNVVVDSDIGSTVQAYDADTTKNDVSNTFTQNQIFNASVGIGTGSPANKLDVNSGTANVAATFRSTDAAVQIRFYDNTTTGNFNSVGVNADDMFIQAEDAIVFKPSNTERMRIDSSGNVGIGTSSPVGNLTVASQNRIVTIGDSGTNNVAEIKATDTAGTNSAFLRLNSYAFQFYTGSAPTTESMVINENGNVVLGGDLLPDTDNTGVVGNSSYTWNNGRFTNLTIDSTLSVRGAIDLADNDRIRVGSGDDMQIWHDGSNTYFRNYLHADGDFIWQGEGTGGTNHTLLQMKNDTNRPYVVLYEDSSERFRTVSGGIDVSGTVYDDGVAMYPNQNYSFGSVGSFCYAISNTNVTYGNTIAGSNLYPSGTASAQSPFTYGGYSSSYYASGSYSVTSASNGTTLSGTWRSLGNGKDPINSTNWWGATLYVRIS